MARHRSQRRFARQYRQLFRDRAQPFDGRPPGLRLHVCPNCWTSRIEIALGKIFCRNCGTFCVRCGLEASTCLHEPRGQGAFAKVQSFD